jgi:hypothetical protein
MRLIFQVDWFRWVIGFHITLPDTPVGAGVLLLVGPVALGVTRDPATALFDDIRRGRL